MSLRFLIPFLASLISLSWQILPARQWLLIPPQTRPTQAQISGKVFTSDDKPIPDTRVVLEASALKEHYETVTSKDGKFSFSDIPEGEYQVKFYLRDGREVVRDVSHYPQLVVKTGPQLGGPRRYYDWPNSTVDLNVPSIATPTATVTPRPSPSHRPSPGPGPEHPTPTPTVTPTTSPSPSSTPMAKIDQILASMQFANISFNVPPSMSLQEAKEVTLLLSLNQNSNELAQQLRIEGAAGEIKEAQIKVHEKVQVLISGDGFLITPSRPDTLPVSKEQTTRWKWDVRALRPGTLRLHVIVKCDRGC
jgi:hypothetical protein